MQLNEESNYIDMSTINSRSKEEDQTTSHLMSNIGDLKRKRTKTKKIKIKELSQR